MKTSIAFIGLGAMGSRMAAHLLEDDGLELTVWNRSPAPVEALVAKGALAAKSPREAAAGRSVVISMLSDDDACRAVWLDGEHAAIHDLAPNTLVLESSTVTPGWIAALNDAVCARGAGLLDAPVAGSRPQAEQGKLIFLVGGDPQHLEQAQPLLQRMGGAVHHTGVVGTGALVKLIVNTHFAIQVASLGELLEVGVRGGLDRRRLQQLLAGLPVMSPGAAGASALMANDDFSPQFPIDLVNKDLAYAGALLRADDGGHSLGKAVARTFLEAARRGLGGENISAISKLFRDAGG